MPRVAALEGRVRTEPESLDRRLNRLRIQGWRTGGDCRGSTDGLRHLDRAVGQATLLWLLTSTVALRTRPF